MVVHVHRKAAAVEVVVRQSLEVVGRGPAQPDDATHSGGVLDDLLEAVGVRVRGAAG